jgi:hypothetical protein
VFKCRNITCEIGEFKISWNGVKEHASAIINLTVSHKNFEASHEKANFKPSVRGEKRMEQKKSIALNGLVNTQSFNSVYNQALCDPSKNDSLVSK